MDNKIVKRYFQWDVDNKICIEYERHGECNQCGDCCRAYVAFQAAGNYIDDDIKNGGDTTDGNGIWSEVYLDDERVFFKTTEIDCKRNDTCGDLLSKGKCKSYNNGRPGICKEWPYSPDDLQDFPKCSYSFEKIEQWHYSKLD